MTHNKHRKVQVVILTTDVPQKVLMLRFAKDRGDGLQNVTGSVDQGETDREAAFREVNEETGLTLSELCELNWSQEFHDRWGKDVVETGFVGLINNIQNVKISEEHSEYKWIEVDQIKDNSYAFSSNYQLFCSALALLKQKALKP